MIKTQTLEGNLINENFSTAFILSQGDKGVPFKVNLLENGTPYSLKSDDVITIEWLKPNNKPFLQEGSIKYGSNYIEFTTPESIAQQYGSGYFNVIISNGTTRKGTIRREYRVVQTSMSPGSVSEDVITDAITELRELSVEIADTVQNNQDLINNNQAATKQDIANVNSSLEDIAINFNTVYPKLSVETNDFARFKRAVEAVPENTILLIPNGTYDMNNADYTITKSIIIKGQSRHGVIFKNIKTVLNGSNITVLNIDVINENSNKDGFEIKASNGNPIENITIENCSVDGVTEHCYIVQDYYGLCKNVVVKNCVAKNAIHGFVSKSEGVQFVDCYAEGMTNDAYVLVSDNIPAATTIGNCKNNKVINCTAYNCRKGANLYSRDMFSSNNSNNIELSNVIFRNFTTIDCDSGIMLGDSTTPASGVTYNAVKDIVVDGYVELGTATQSLVVCRCEDSTFDKLNLSNSWVWVTGQYKNCKYSNVQTSLDSLGGLDGIPYLQVGSATPPVNGFTDLTVYRTNNTSTTKITNLVNAKDRQVVIVYFDENFTEIYNGGNFRLSRGLYKGAGSFVILKLRSGLWWEIGGGKTATGSFKRYLDSDGTALDLTASTVWEVTASTASATTTNKISVKGMPKNGSEIITIIVRAYLDGFTWGGWDTDKFHVPDNVKTSVTNGGTAYITNWVYLNSTNKWICIGVHENSFVN